MKQKIISLFIFCLIFSFIVCGQSEKKSTYNLGFDPITQGIYFGFEQAIQNYAIGLDVGSSFGLALPLNVTVSLDNALYFGKQNKYNIKTWHANARLAYTKLVVENKPNLLHIVPSIGKIFRLNEKLGLNLEVGVAYQVLDDWGEPMIGGGSIYHFDQGFTPNIRIELKF